MTEENQEPLEDDAVVDQDAPAAPEEGAGQDDLESTTEFVLPNTQPFNPSAEEVTDKDPVYRFYVNGRYVRTFTLAQTAELRAAVTKQNSLGNNTDAPSKFPETTDAEVDKMIREKYNITDTGA